MPGLFCPTSFTPREKGGLLQEERIFRYWLVGNESTEHQSWNSMCWVLKSLEDIEVPWRGRSQIGRPTGYAWLIFCRLQSFPLLFAEFPCLAASLLCSAQLKAVSVSTILEDVDVNLARKICVSVPVLWMLKFPWGKKKISLLCLLVTCLTYWCWIWLVLISVA